MKTKAKLVKVGRFFGRIDPLPTPVPRHRHDQSMWLIAGGHWMWCYQCGAIRKTNAFGDRWEKPTGLGGPNPAMSDAKLPKAQPRPLRPTSCGNCHYDEAEGELLEQCFQCKAIDEALAKA